MEPNGALNTTDPDLDLNIRKEMSKDSKRASKKERGGKKKSKRSSALPALPKPPYTLTKFSDFVKNHIKEIHSELQKLLSILPNEKHQNRNQLLLQFTLWVKKESAKIRGAYRYLKKRGETLETCRGLITLFHKENAKITKFCQGMTGTYDSFANARVGRFDVPAALDVFEGGTYRTFPKIVEEKIVSPPKLVENEVQNTMSLLTDTIFMRYLTKEAIPEDWQSGVKIDSGKLIFTKKDVYEVCLTLLGTGEDLPWHFVYANIFVKGYDIPKDTEPNRLMDPNQYSRLAYTCQQKLLPDHLKDPIINPMTNQVEPFQQDTDPKFEAIKKAGKTPYLTYLRDYLNKFAIDVQFEILCLQTLKISKTRWSELLKVEIDPAHTVLKLNYWHREDPIEFVKAYKLDNPQCLQIEKSKTGDMVLQVNWTGSSVQTLCKLLNVQQLAKITDEEKQLILNPTSINAEELLLKVIRVHTKLILLKFQELIVSMKVEDPSLFAKRLTDEDVFLEEKEALYLSINYSSHRKLKLSLDPRNGRSRIYLINEKNEEVRVKELEKAIDSSPIKIGEELLKWRLSRVVDDIKFMSGYHSFSFTDSLFMDPTDGIKFGNHFEGLTYLFTPRIKNQFIVIGFLNQKLKFYYIGVKPTQTFLSLSFMVPINQDIKRIFENVNYLDQTELIIKYTQSDSNIKNDLMGALVRISHAHYLSSSIGVQLNQISVKRFISLPLFPPPRATINGHDLAMPYPIPPSLLSFNVKNEFNNSTHNNITQIYNIHCDDLNNALKITAPYVKGPICVFAASNYLSWVAFTCELDADFAEVYYQKAEKTDRWRLDEMDFMKERISFKRYFLTFVYQEFSTCLTDFCDDWKAFTFASNFYLEAHLIKLHLLSMKIKSFSLDCLTISYHQYYSLTVGWGYPDDLSVGEKKPKLRVLLHSEHPQNVRNPHLRIQFQLESLFNQTLSLTKLLHEIYLTLPVLSSLDEYEKRMLRGVNIIPKSCNAFRLIYSPSYSINVEIISQTKVRISDGSIFVDPKRAPPTPWNSKPVNISKKSTDDGKKAEEQKNQPPLRANSLNIHPEHIPYFKVFSSALPYLLEKSIANNPGFHPFNHNDNAVICSAHLIADILRALDWVFTLYSTFQSAYRTNPNQDPNKIPAFTAEEEYNYTYISNVGTWAIKAKEHLSTVECEALSLEPSDKSSRKLAHNLCDIFLGYLNRRLNVGVQLIHGRFNSAMVATYLPLELIEDLVECINIIDKSGPYEQLTGNLEWFLTVPGAIPHPFFKAFKPNVQACVLYKNVNIVKLLFYIERENVRLYIPLEYDLNKNNLKVSSSPTYRDPVINDTEAVALFSALWALLERFNLDIGEEKSMVVSKFLKHLFDIPMDNFKGLIPTINRS